MIEHPYTIALLAMIAFGFFGWLASVIKDDVSIVDSMWSLFFLLAVAVFAITAASESVRVLIVAALVTIWALRLSIYITARNWGLPEDYRYRTIRANNEPGFVYKSAYLIFGLQAVLAWLVALPLLPAIQSPAALGLIDAIAVALWLTGFVFEVVGDQQLARFKRRSDSAGRVLDRGLWRYTRHPNYFGEFCIWWAFFLFAVPAGAWWTIVSPLLMSFLLLRVSGVAMLEKTIGDRRPEYAEYVARTNAFFPGPRRRQITTVKEAQS